MFVGYDGEGLAAVGMYEPRPPEKSFYIRAVARAQRLAHKRVADEALSHMIDQITREPEYVDAGFREIFCEIHWKNTASKNLFRRAGFERIGHDDASGLETWGLDLGYEQVDFADVDDRS